MLLEDLGPSLANRGRPVPDQLRCLADTLALAWQDPGETRPPPGEDKASGLAQLIRAAWDRLDRPCPVRVADQALGYAERRAAEFDRPGRGPGRPAPGQPAGRPSAPGPARRPATSSPTRTDSPPTGRTTSECAARLVEHPARTRRPDGGRGLLQRARRPRRGRRPADLGMGVPGAGVHRPLPARRRRCPRPSGSAVPGLRRTTGGLISDAQADRRRAGTPGCAPKRLRRRLAGPDRVLARSGRPAPTSGLTPTVPPSAASPASAPTPSTSPTLTGWRPPSRWPWWCTLPGSGSRCQRDGGSAGDHRTEPVVGRRAVRRPDASGQLRRRHLRRGAAGRPQPYRCAGCPPGRRCRPQRPGTTR